MSVATVLRREMQVAFSRNSQPVWFRAAKWAFAVFISVLLWGTPYFWFWILGGLALGLTVHFIWRWKTRGWTQPWGGWDDREAIGK